MSEDELSVCPFNAEHKIITYRLPGHILKCQKSYRGPPLETCIYNACHLFPATRMQEHLQTCRDRHLFHTPDYEKSCKRDSI